MLVKIRQNARDGSSEMYQREKQQQGHGYENDKRTEGC